MSISKFVFIVSMNVKKEYEDLFNEVYDEEHVPHLLDVPGVNRVTRGKGIPFNFSISWSEMVFEESNFVVAYLQFKLSIKLTEHLFLDIW